MNQRITASHWDRRTLAAAVCAACVWALVGCAATNEAPVEDHSTVHAAPHPVASAAEAAKPPPPAASAPEAHPGTYVVQAGDMLTKIGLDTGQSWHDLARWNNLTDPNHLEVGQVLRVVPPAGEAATTTTTTVTTTTATFKPLPAKGEARPAESKASGATAAASAAGSGPALPPAASSPPVPLTGAASPPSAAAHESDDEPAWAWPANGAVVAPFDDAKSKGLSIAGKPGDPVYAAADGKVVYAGSGLRGYGNLVIVKHNANYLTAYAHNQVLLVKEDQFVKRGQKIAEMGSTDTDRVQLHFEIRKQGKPVDPAKLLPAR
jgi:lipoprotein NlpD